MDKRTEVCPVCKGRKRIKIRNHLGVATAIAPCPPCDGEGVVTEEKLAFLRVVEDVTRIEDEGKVKQFPMKDPDLPWEV